MIRIASKSILLTGIIFLFHACNTSQQASNLSDKNLKSDTLIAFQTDWENLPNGEINMSFLLEKPAGKNGFIQLEKGHFFTPDGNRFRIWGVNLTAGACYPERENAKKVAKLLSSLGINAVRFHFLDSNWGNEKSIFNPESDNTQEFNPEQLDKLDYFVAELKKEGIYSNFNLNVGRNYRKGDNVPFYEHLGFAKAVTLFDDRIIELQKDYAFKLLTHVNSYTGNEYRNEPALAFLEIVNENSLVEAWFGSRLNGTHNNTQTTTWMDIPKYYSDELTTKYNQWLKKNISEAELQEITNEAGAFQTGIIPRLKVSEFEKASKLRFHSEAKFIIETENKFFSGMYSFLKDEVMVNQFIAANSDHNHWKSGYALLFSTSKLDFIDGHVYWQHPRYLKDDITGKQTFSIENTAMVNDPSHSSVASLSRSAVSNKPYTVSETNHPYPNEYACEGIPILAAYALLQDWDGIYFYTFEHEDPSRWKSRIPGHFDLLNDPAKLANLLAASMMYHRGDLEAAESTVLRSYTKSEIAEGIRSGAEGRPFFTPEFPPETPLVSKTRINNFEGGKNEFPAYKTSSTIISETGQLEWLTDEDQGLVIINSEKTQALIGFSEKMTGVSTANMNVQLSTPFAALFLSSIDGKSISLSEKILLSATSTSILSGAEWNSERTSLETWGTLPFMIKPVAGEVRLSKLKQSGNLKVTPLDSSGNALDHSATIKIRKGKATFKIGQVPTVWYLLEIKS